MLIRQPLLWIAATLLAAAVVWTAMPQDGDEDVQPRQAARQELFPFVQPLPADAGENIVREVAEAPAPSAIAAHRPADAADAASNAFRTEETVRRMRAQGASDDEVYRARAAVLGAEAAASLARLDREEAFWQQRVAAYLNQRQALAENMQAIQSLKDRLFTTEEQARLAAYEPATLPLVGMPQ